MIFSEETSRAIHEMVNMELIELKQTSATIQSFLLEASTRGIKHVSMRRCSSTQSLYNGPNPLLQR